MDRTPRPPYLRLETPTRVAPPLPVPGRTVLTPPAAPETEPAAERPLAGESAAALRLRLREHLTWVLGAAGVAVASIALPEGTWYWTLLRVGVGTGGIGWALRHLGRRNAVLQELQQRVTPPAA